MMPDEWASIRSIARCVLPVLVGPSTAVTPVPRGDALRCGGEEKKTLIRSPEASGLPRLVLYHNATHRHARIKQRNESRTNRARIADSTGFGFRSRRIWGHAPPMATK